MTDTFAPKTSHLRAKPYGARRGRAVAAAVAAVPVALGLTVALVMAGAVPLLLALPLYSALGMVVMLLFMLLS